MRLIFILFDKYENFLTTKISQITICKKNTVQDHQTIMYIKVSVVNSSQEAELKFISISSSVKTIQFNNARGQYQMLLQY